uniref:Uncharacterized protein n=1 Tax=Ditylenchus dipsaci TaxID=166011 RepID=A0A915EIG9_9BILA
MLTPSANSTDSLLTESNSRPITTFNSPPTTSSSLTKSSNSPLFPKSGQLPHTATTSPPHPISPQLPHLTVHPPHTTSQLELTSQIQQQASHHTQHQPCHHIQKQSTPHNRQNDQQQFELNNILLAVTGIEIRMTVFEKKFSGQ